MASLMRARARSTSPIVSTGRVYMRTHLINTAGCLSRTVARLRRAWSWYLAYVLATSVDVPQVRLPRRSGRAPRFGSAAYVVPSARLDLATASFMRRVLVQGDAQLGKV